jgi:hypothetical protein
MAVATAFLAPAPLAGPADQGKAEAVTVYQAKADEQGFLVHEVRSPYQARTR